MANVSSRNGRAANYARAKHLCNSHLEKLGEGGRIEIYKAGAAAALSHPNIAMINAILSPRPELFGLMKFIEGRELHDIIVPPPLDIASCQDLAFQIAASLQTVRARGLAHRQIKSTKIRVTGSGRVKIFEFWLAEMRDAALQKHRGEERKLHNSAIDTTATGDLFVSALAENNVPESGFTSTAAQLPGRSPVTRHARAS